MTPGASTICARKRVDRGAGGTRRRTVTRAALLAGGQSLVPMLCFRLAQPGVVVDIGGLDGLSGVAAEKGVLRLGCAGAPSDCRSTDPVIARAAPLLAEAARWVATPTVRNAGTLGGRWHWAIPRRSTPPSRWRWARECTLASAAWHAESVEAEALFFLGAMDTGACARRDARRGGFDAASTWRPLRLSRDRSSAGATMRSSGGGQWRGAQTGDLRVAVSARAIQRFWPEVRGRFWHPPPPESMGHGPAGGGERAARSDLAGSAQDAGARTARGRGPSRARAAPGGGCMNRVSVELRGERARRCGGGGAAHCSCQKLLRGRLCAATSVHIGCGQGICGACTVLLDGKDPAQLHDAGRLGAGPKGSRR